MTKNIKILTVALILMAAVFMRVMNSTDNTQSLQGSLQAPGLTTNNSKLARTAVHDCLTTPSRVNLTQESLTTIAFQLDQKSNVQVQIKEKDKTLQTLPSQGTLNSGPNKLVWTNNLIKELVGGKAGDYTIRIAAKDEKDSTLSTFCEVPLTVENK